MKNFKEFTKYAVILSAFYSPVSHAAMVSADSKLASGESMSVLSYAIEGNFKRACSSETRDTNGLISQVEAKNPELKGAISATDGLITSPYSGDCFTNLSLNSPNYELVSHTARKDSPSADDFKNALKDKQVVYYEIDGKYGDNSNYYFWLTVEKKQSASPAESENTAKLIQAQPANIIAGSSSSVSAKAQ